MSSGAKEPIAKELNAKGKEVQAKQKYELKHKSEKSKVENCKL